MSEIRIYIQRSPISRSNDKLSKNLSYLKASRRQDPATWVWNQRSVSQRHNQDWLKTALIWASSPGWGERWAAARLFALSVRAVNKYEVNRWRGHVRRLSSVQQGIRKLGAFLVLFYLLFAVLFHRPSAPCRRGKKEGNVPATGHKDNFAPRGERERQTKGKETGFFSPFEILYLSPAIPALLINHYRRRRGCHSLGFFESNETSFSCPF